MSPLVLLRFILYYKNFVESIALVRNWSYDRFPVKGLLTINILGLEIFSCQNRALIGHT